MLKKSMIIQRAGDTALKTEFVTSSKFTYCKKLYIHRTGIYCVNVWWKQWSFEKF